ncbi:hypothetical protein OSB04_023704 [Centaurea solstitialis]|uniref:Reverse transcriptase zinc-binding domain-containing protein n=1 Tax=Centaurea solstitialis TaxID=347529 RepID=A0AA38VZX7_9ASTR|nr:hypothetical protein OSB04_023704 [Centaurea solstitialis]
MTKGSEDTCNIHLNCLFQWQLGDGANIRFWKDVWDGSTNLETKFPRIASLNTKYFLHDYGAYFQEFERREVLRQLAMIDQKWAQRDHREYLQTAFDWRRLGGWTWALTTDGQVSVASLCKSIDDMFLRKCVPLTAWNSTRVFSSPMTCARSLLQGKCYADHICVNCRKVIEVRRTVNLRRV